MAKNSGNSDMYSIESKLINDSVRKLADGEYRDPMQKLRLLCCIRGATGILGLARAFRHMDDDRCKSLNKQQFMRGIQEFGLDINSDEIEEIFASFDADTSGSIDMTEFLLKLRPPMSQSRLSIIDQAFAKMDNTGNGDGIITLKEVKKYYSVHEHPSYQNGEMTKDEIITEFLHNFEGGGGHLDGSITKEEFVNYYAALGASIDNDTFFDLMMRQAYKL